MVLAHTISHTKRTEDIRITEDVTFDTMLLSEKTLSGLRDSGFFKPSPIQLNGIPLGKCGFDLLLEAKSGTGKTAVFAVISLEKLDLAKSIQTVILAPTREIAAQICDVIKQIGSSFNGLKVEVVMGGLPVQEDIQKFKNKVHIVVGSPGRLRHLIQDNHIDISSVRLLILDEADKLMEKSFQRDINYIFSVLPKQKQVIMSSATYPECSKLFINKYVRNAQHICPDSNSVLLGITQKVSLVKFNSYIVRQTQHRFEELLKILSKMQFKQCLIFCNYQARVGELHKMLTRAKWPAEQLYGQQEQTERLGALKILQEYKCRILIATDLAARGIDASNIDLVINFEPPFEWPTYLHRIGRAGRFGSYGTAITILSEGNERNKFQAMLSSIKFPLNLTKIWSDDIFNNERDNFAEVENKASTEQSFTTVNKKTSDELWCALINENNEIEDTLQSFDKLHYSFEQFLDPKIDSFSTLVNSLNTYQPNTKEEDNKLICSVSASKTGKDNLDFVHSLKSNKLKKINQTNKIGQTSYSSELFNKETRSPDSGEDLIKDDFDYNIDKSCKDYGEEIISSDCQNSFTKYNVNENNDIIEDSPQIINKVKSNLRDDNLISEYPKAFCSSRDKRDKRKQYGSHSKQGNYNMCDKYCDSWKDTELKHFYSAAKTNHKRSSEYLIHNIGSDSKCKITARNELKTFNDFIKTYNSYVSNSFDIRPIQIETTKSSLRNNYIIWYNQLKAQMSQIELSVYIDEISRLHK